VTAGLPTVEPGAVPAKRPKARQRSLVGAEVLRLRRRRGLMITFMLLAFGIFVLVGLLLSLLHVANPAKFGPPGGVDSISGFGIALAELGSIGGVLVGAFAGSADLSAGVFRALVTTGRPRWQLFLARVPAVLIIIVPVIVVTWAAICVYSVALSFGSREASAAAMESVGAWVLLNVCVWAIIALAFSAIVGSRSTTVAVMIAIDLIGGGILSAPGLPYLGLRQAFFFVTLRYIMPSGILQGAGRFGHEAPLLGAVVIGLWIFGMLAIATRRTTTRDV
jgi:ABC-type transport system involved in multi-copper enzyme maturation permease subunit